MSAILTYVLHKDGEFNKNSLGAVSEAAKLAGEIGGEAAAVVVGEGDDLTDDQRGRLCAELAGQLRRLRDRALRVLVEVALVVVERINENSGHG